MFPSTAPVSFDSNAFRGCAKLSNIYIPANETVSFGGTYSSNAFDNCSSSGAIWYHNDAQASIANNFKSAFDAFRDKDTWLVTKITTL
jgi:hypothetical protein